MERPKFPSSSKIDRAKMAMSNGDEILLKRYFSSVDTYEELCKKSVLEELKSTNHIRFYRVFSVLSGTFLALSSLLLCAYAINQKVDILPIAAILAPVTGLAGIFVWGYRPGDSTKLSKKILNQLIDNKDRRE